MDNFFRYCSYCYSNSAIFINKRKKEKYLTIL